MQNKGPLAPLLLARSPCAACERGCCAEAASSGRGTSARGDLRPSPSPPGRADPPNRDLAPAPPAPPPRSPTSAPGSGVRKRASSRAPLRMGSGRSASASSIAGTAGSSRRGQPASPSPRPGLGAPPLPAARPAASLAEAGQVRAAAHASRSAGPSGQRHPVARGAHCARPRPAGKQEVLKLRQLAVSRGSSNFQSSGHARSRLKPGRQF